MQLKMMYVELSLSAPSNQINMLRGLNFTWSHALIVWLKSLSRRSCSRTMLNILQTFSVCIRFFVELHRKRSKRFYCSLFYCQYLPWFTILWRTWHTSLQKIKQFTMTGHLHIFIDTKIATMQCIDNIKLTNSSWIKCTLKTLSTVMNINSTQPLNKYHIICRYF